MPDRPLDEMNVCGCGCMGVCMCIGVVCGVWCQSRREMGWDDDAVKVEFAGRPCLALAQRGRVLTADDGRLGEFLSVVVAAAAAD